MSAKKVILVIEDEEPILNVISFKLKRSGFTVVTAKTAEQALDYMNHIKVVDFIWLDHYLEGGTNGLEFVEAIKRPGSKWSSVPIFLISNTSYPEKHQAYLALGVEKYYTKSNHGLLSIISDVKKYLKEDA